MLLFKKNITHLKPYFLSLLMITTLVVSGQNSKEEIEVFIIQTEELRANAPDKALNLINKAYGLSIEIADTFLVIQSGVLYATVQNENGLSEKALGTILHLKPYLNTLPSDTNITKIHLVSGHIYSNLLRFEEALKSYRTALKLYEILKDTSGITASYMGIGGAYSNLPDLDKAIDYYKLASEYSDENNTHTKAGIYTNIGTVYGRLNELGNAETFYRLALKLYQKENSKRDLSLIYYNLGKVLMNQNNLNSSIKEFNTSLKIGMDIKSNVDILWAHEGLYSVYKKMGESHKALFHYEKYTYLNDSLEKSQNKKEIRKLEAFYEKQQQDLIITNQQKKIEDASYREELYKERISKSKLEKIFLWIDLVVLVIIILSGISIYKKIKKKNTLLTQQKEVINTALGEKEILLKEIHHRVKNNLQIITSLLNLQSYRVNDPILLDILNESKNRIQAIALVHEKLYQSKNLAQINFKGYLNDLVNQQKSVLEDRGNPVTCIINAANINLNIDIAVPLGLIVSELIVNSFKHAFSQKVQSPILELTLVENRGTEIELTIHDNGKGLPQNFDIKTNDSLGMEIVSALSEQINADVHYKNENGALFRITFNNT